MYLAPKVVQAPLLLFHPHSHVSMDHRLPARQIVRFTSLLAGEMISSDTMMALFVPVLVCCGCCCIYLFGARPRMYVEKWYKITLLQLLLQCPHNLFFSSYDSSRRLASTEARRRNSSLCFCREPMAGIIQREKENFPARQLMGALCSKKKV